MRGAPGGAAPAGWARSCPAGCQFYRYRRRGRCRRRLRRPWCRCAGSGHSRNRPGKSVLVPARLAAVGPVVGCSCRGAAGHSNRLQQGRFVSEKKQERVAKALVQVGVR
jgi:hypothetical protein